MYNLTILLRKAYATEECGDDVRELRCWGGFGKIVRTPAKILATPLPADGLFVLLDTSTMEEG